MNMAVTDTIRETKWRVLLVIALFQTEPRSEVVHKKLRERLGRVSPFLILSCLPTSRTLLPQTLMQKSVLLWLIASYTGE